MTDRDGVLVEKPLHQNQFAYRAGVSTETALFQVVHRLEKSLNHEEIALGAFLDIEGAFDNTSFNAITTAAREHGLEETSYRWVRSKLESRLVHTPLWEAVSLLELKEDVHREEFGLLFCGT